MQSVGVYTEAQARLESHLKRLQTEMPFSDIDTASMSHDADGIEGFGLNHNVTEFESPRRLESSRHSENEIKTENPNLIPFPAAGAVR